MEAYGAYIIEIEEEKKGQWKAHIRRRDGKPISTAPYGSDHISVLSTKTHFSEEKAVDEAKAMIDRGHMK